VHWFCVRTLPGLHLTADIEIRLAGFEVFNPTMWKAAVPARRGPNGSLRPALPVRIVPLFPRYLMARFHRSVDPWTRIRSLAGVDSILGTDPRTPAAVPDEAIALIRSRLMPNDCLYPDNVELRDAGPVVHVAPGTRARLLEGPLADIAGICQWSDDKRVRLLLSLLGREVVVTVERSAVEVA
jgi:transcription antitermination factor NusG